MHISFKRLSVHASIHSSPEWVGFDFRRERDTVSDGVCQGQHDSIKPRPDLQVLTCRALDTPVFGSSEFATKSCRADSRSLNPGFWRRMKTFEFLFTLRKLCLRARLVQSHAESWSAGIGAR